jgi:hypothetical protein
MLLPSFFFVPRVIAATPFLGLVFHFSPAFFAIVMRTGHISGRDKRRRELRVRDTEFAHLALHECARATIFFFFFAHFFLSSIEERKGNGKNHNKKRGDTSCKRNKKKGGTTQRETRHRELSVAISQLLSLLSSSRPPPFSPLSLFSRSSVLHKRRREMASALERARAFLAVAAEQADQPAPDGPTLDAEIVAVRDGEDDEQEQNGDGQEEETGPIITLDLALGVLEPGGQKEGDGEAGEIQLGSRRGDNLGREEELIREARDGEAPLGTLPDLEPVRGIYISRVSEQDDEKSGGAPREEEMSAASAFAEPNSSVARPLIQVVDNPDAEGK